MNKALRQLKERVLETIRETAEIKAVHWYELGLYQGMKLFKEQIKKGNIKVINKNKSYVFRSQHKDILWEPRHMTIKIKDEPLTIRKTFRLSFSKVGIKTEK